MKKKENKMNGEFTTISYSVLRNKNLTAISKLLLIEILSDADDFEVSQTLYCKRLGISSNTWFNSINNLIQNGYVQRIEKFNKGGRKFYDYDIDETGSFPVDHIEKSVAPVKKEIIIKTSTPPVKEDIKPIMDWSFEEKVKEEPVAPVYEDVREDLIDDEVILPENSLKLLNDKIIQIDNDLMDYYLNNIKPYPILKKVLSKSNETIVNDFIREKFTDYKLSHKEFERN